MCEIQYCTEKGISLISDDVMGIRGWGWCVSVCEEGGGGGGLE